MREFENLTFSVNAVSHNYETQKPLGYACFLAPTDRFGGDAEFLHCRGTVGRAPFYRQSNHQEARAIPSRCLVDRSQGKTVPTAFVKRRIASARRAIAELHAAGRDIKLMENFASGRLVIGVDPLVSESLLSLPMTKMMNSYASLQFTVRLCNRPDWEDARPKHGIDT